MTNEYPQEAVIVSRDKVNTENPYDIIDSNIQFLNDQFDELLAQDEVSVDALRSYYVDYFLGQLENGGFLEFFLNSGWDEYINQFIFDGLQAMGAVKHVACLRQGEELVNRLGPERVIEVFESDAKEYSAEHSFLHQLNEAMFIAGEEEDLVELNSRWLHQLPNLTPLNDEEIVAVIKQRAAAVPNRAEREAEALENEPRAMRLIRALCVAANHQLKRFANGDPTYEFQGQNTIAWNFVTDQGNFFMVDFQGTAYMLVEGTDQCICELEATKDYGPDEFA